MSGKTLKIALGILFLFVAVVFLVTPLCGDTRIFLASSHQAHLRGDFPGNVLDTWELKPAGNRYFMYALYSIVTSVTDFSHKTGIEFGSRLVGLLMVLILLAGVYWKEKNIFPINIAVLRSTIYFLLLTAVSYWIPFQAEYNAIIILFVAYWMILWGGVWFPLFSGLLLSSLFLFKGVTFLYAFYIPLVLYFRSWQWRDLIWPSIGFIIGNIVLLIGLGTFLQGEWEILMEATFFQESFSINLSLIFFRIKRIAFRFLDHATHYPLLFALVISTLVGLKANINQEKPIVVILFWLYLIGLAGVVFLQGQFFAYHYLSLAPALLLLLEFKSFYTRKNLILISTVFLILYVFGNTPLFPMWYEEKQRVAQTQDNWREIKDQIDDREILYLDDGRGAYYLGNPSYSRYFFNLPIQRADMNNTRLRQSTIYSEELKNILAYSGKYVVLQPSWFKLHNHPDIEEMLDQDYILQEQTGPIQLFKRRIGD